jgi:ubiquinone/menaquinone biosynthesis C-methylase UbiE
MPYIKGHRVLEVSFGTGYLLSQIASDYEVYGVEYNEKLLQIGKENLASQGLSAKLVKGSVEDLPYPNQYFDSVVVTMAFTGYPDGRTAMSELKRVLKNDGRLLIVDINYPKDQGNCLGMFATKLWKAAGDIIRDMGSLFHEFDLQYTDEEVGGFGSVHLYVVTKK